MVEDSLDGLSWLRGKVGPGVDIYVFAHSLGTAVAAHALSKHSGEVSGLILMSPFNNFLAEVIWSVEQTSSWLKYYLWTAVWSVTGSALPGYLLRLLDVQFNTDQHLL